MGWSPHVNNPDCEPGILQLLIPRADDDRSRCVWFFGLVETWWVSFLSFCKEQTAHFNCFIPLRICAPRVCEGQWRRQLAQIWSAVSARGEYSSSVWSTGPTGRAAGCFCAYLRFTMYWILTKNLTAQWVTPCVCLGQGRFSTLRVWTLLAWQVAGWVARSLSLPWVTFMTRSLSFVGTMLCRPPAELSPSVKHSGI